MGKFYRKIGENKMESREVVKSRLYTLRPDDPDKSNLPDNWYWFETDKEAEYFFQITKEIWDKTRAKKLVNIRLEDVVSLLNKVTPDYIPEAFLDRELNRAIRRKNQKIEEFNANG